MKSFFSSNSYLGIDIGSSSIKIVELKDEGGGAKLLTYGFTESTNLDNFYQRSRDVSIEQTARIINQVCEQVGAVSRSAVAALPTFSVFSSVLNLSGVSKGDLASAVHWEAKKVIPLPLDEMILDWKEIKTDEKKDIEKILLTGAPKALVKKYIDTFREAQINLLSLETEIFSLIRSLLGTDKSTIMIVEIGTTTTDISIVDNRIPLLSRSIDIGGFTITKAISHTLNIGLERAEQFKYDLGIGSIDSPGNVIPKTIAETVSPIVNEIKYALNLFQSKNEKKVEKIILSGGSALLVNFTNYLSKLLNIKVVISNPWSRISYPVDLKPILEEIGPRMSVAIGLAMKQIE